MTTTDVPDPSSPAPDVSLADFQRLIRQMYFERDVARGVEGTFMWLMAEVGELAEALRNGSHEERLGEFADVLAWLTTIANVTPVRGRGLGRRVSLVGRLRVGQRLPLGEAKATGIIRRPPDRSSR